MQIQQADRASEHMLELQFFGGDAAGQYGPYDRWIMLGTNIPGTLSLDFERTRHSDHSCIRHFHCYYCSRYCSNC